MSARPLHRQLRARIPLLGDADHCDRTAQAGEDPARDGAPFVEDELGVDVARAEALDDRVGARARDLLIVAEGEVHGARGLEALREKRLDRFERGEHADLVVEGTTPPDEPLGEVAREGRVVPARERGGFDWHDVHVPHQDDRRERGVGAAPGEEQVVGGHHLAHEGVMHAREVRLELMVQAEERVPRRGRVGPAHGGEPHGARETRRGSAVVHQGVARWRGARPRRRRRSGRYT